MKFDPLYYPHAAQRMATYASRGMVAASQPLAAEAGQSILRLGGNAVDAAIATAACLTVVEPTANGIGSDAFALIWHQGRLHGLNASGPAPQSISVAALKALGHTEMPKFGWLPVTVPGAPAGWAEMSARLGKLPLTTVLAPAIELAAGGFPLSPTLGRSWKGALLTDRGQFKGAEYEPYFALFAPHGRPPEIGEIWRSPEHAATLASIAATRGESFYRGELAEKMVAFAKQHGGFLEKADLENYRPEWVTPIAVDYRGYEVWQLPPNGQGLVSLIALNILKELPFSAALTLETCHQQIEAIKIAFSIGFKHITDPNYMQVTTAELLSDDFARRARLGITARANTPEPLIAQRGGTVYLATADGEGNMVSYIQSNYMGFGSRIVIPGTGIALQNRGNSFTLDEGHINAIAGGKRPYHTIIPGFLTHQKQAMGPFGVMGGFMQPQAHVQVLMNCLDFNHNPQAALDAPRWQWISGNTLHVEPTFPNHLAQALNRQGHQVVRTLDSTSFGRGQIIWRDPDTGVLCGGTESRTDGHIACY
ncbi:MAG: putative gamma-glutamyltransferase YwrD [Firmicutes bacterium]|nr:putative gamma-glutamyltransferase YwrD [Bacillota bacterium]